MNPKDFDKDCDRDFDKFFKGLESLKELESLKGLGHTVLLDDFLDNLEVSKLDNLAEKMKKQKAIIDEMEGIAEAMNEIPAEFIKKWVKELKGIKTLEEA